MRIFLSFNSRDTALAEAVRAGLSRLEPKPQISFSSVSLGAGFWLPKFADEIAQVEAFLLLIGPNGKALGRKSNTSRRSSLLDVDEGHQLKSGDLRRVQRVSPSLVANSGKPTARQIYGFTA